MVGRLGRVRSGEGWPLEASIILPPILSLFFKSTTFVFLNVYFVILINIKILFFSILILYM